MSAIKNYLCSAAIVGIFLQGQTCAAESTPSATPAATSSGDDFLREIVVTATRRSEELSKVPISIVALDQAALTNAGIKTVSDLAQYVPGVEFDTTSGFGTTTSTNIAIRGVNSNIGTSTTGIYLDDVPIQTRIVALSYWGNPFPLLFDVDRVEVDRGPQGTLFGAGAEGGAIRLISPEPGYETFSGFARGEVSSTLGGAPSFETGIAAGGPIVSNKVGFRASFWGRRDGGYVDRVDPFTGQTVSSNSNSTTSYVGRLAFGIKAGDALTLTPALFVQNIHPSDSPAWYESLSSPDNTEFKNGRLVAQPSLERLVLPSLKVEAALQDVTVTSISAFFHREASLTQDGTNYLGAIFGSFISYGNPAGFEYPASYADAAPFFLHTKVNLLTQELRVSSNDASARLRWTVGAFFSHSSQTDTEDVTSAFYSTNAFGLSPDSPILYSQITSTDTQIAGFAQADYKITPQLTLTVGGRVSHNIAKFTQFQSGPVASQEFPSASGEQSETPFIPKAELTYQINDDDMVYASASKGYRVGGANQPIPLAPTPSGCPLASQPPPFSSDSVWSYELGSKLRLFDSRLRVDASVFYVDWSKIQQQIYFTSCSFGFIANTGNARSYGFDWSARFAVTDHFNVGMSVAYTDAKVTKTSEFDGAILFEKGDVIGSPAGVTSPWNLSASGEYNFTIAAHRAYVRVEDFYRSQNPGPFNTQISTSPLYDPTIPANPAYNVMNARIGFNYSAVDIAVFVNNVANRLPALYRFRDTVESGLFTDTTLRPRTIGISANYKF